VSPALFLLTVAGIFLIGAIGELVFRKTNVPDVVWLIAAGVLLGPVLHLVDRERLSGIAPYFAPITLTIVLFDGGSKLRISDLSRAAPRSGLLAVLTFALSTAGLAAACMGARKLGWFPESFTWMHCLLIGAILGGSSSIIIMPAMTQAKVDEKVSNLVGLESAFTDAFCVVGASALIDMLVPGRGGVSPWIVLGKSFGIGAAIGVVAGGAWLVVLRLLKGSEHAYTVTLASLFVLYVIIERAGGSAALGILSFAVLVGNARSFTRESANPLGMDLGDDVRGFHRQMTFFVKSFFFTFIGAMLGPPWGLLALGAGLGLVLLVVRVPGLYLAVVGSSLTPQQKKLAVVSLPRGMAAGVLATMPAAAGIEGTAQLPSVVFAAVLVTILTFAIGFPIVRRG
jgi:potassium/hydrogen antiporter